MNKLRISDDFPSQPIEAWKELVDKALKGKPFEDALVSTSYDAIKINPLYTKTDSLGTDTAGFPGTAPLTRGTKVLPQKPSWQIQQIIVNSEPGTANQAILEDLKGGTSSIELLVANPGQSGIKIDTAQDLERTLKDVHLDMAPVSIRASSDYYEMGQFLIQLLTDRLDKPEQANGALNADPLGTLVRLGSLPENIDQAYRKISELARICTERLGSVKAIVADGIPYHEAGASEAQEIACVAATTVAYLKALESHGLDPEVGLKQITFSFAADADLFLTISKFRAARRILFRIAEASNAGPQAQTLRISARSSNRMMSKKDPYVNILRGTVACAGAAFGGADMIAILPPTWPIGQPDKFARRIARNTQLVLQEESSLGAVIDPAGGSWFVEQFTEALAQKSWEIFQEIESRGGMFEALQKGTVQAMIRGTAQARTTNIALSKDELTGVSAFPHLAEKFIDAEPYPACAEIEDETFTVEPLIPHRLAEPFEKLRDESDKYLQATGQRPKIFLANLGRISDFNARANYATNFFASGGIEAIANDGFATTESAAEAFRQSGAKIACLCSSDEIYNASAANTAQSLQNAGAKHIYMAGRPGEASIALREAGIGTFIYKGCNMLEILRHTHEALEISC